VNNNEKKSNRVGRGGRVKRRTSTAPQLERFQLDRIRMKPRKQMKEGRGEKERERVRTNRYGSIS